MTPEEKAFYETTEKAWEIAPNSCSSAVQAAMSVKNKMQLFGLPVWSLEDVDTTGAYDVVKKYIELVQKEGSEAHKLAIMIGSASRVKTNLGDQLHDLLTVENCQKGMKLFLKDFENGKLLNLANEIGANETLLKDISSLFSVQYSSLWNAETGKEQIKTLIVDYSFVKCTNYILGTAASSKKAAFDEWKEKLKFSMCSCEGIQSICPSLAGNFEFLLKIVKEEELLPDHLNSYTDDLIRNQDDIKSYFDNEVSFFKKLYADYLEDIEEDDILKLKTQDLIGIFKKSKTDGNAVVKKVAEEYRKSQKKTQMFELWKSKTGTKNPADWSAKHRTPILKMVDKSEYDDAKKAFETLNRTTSTEIEIEKTLEFLQNTEVYSKLSNQDLVDEAFKSLLGSYKANS